MRLPAARLLLAIALGCNGAHASTSNARSSPSVAVATTSSAGAPVTRVGKACGPITNEARALDALQAAWNEEILPNNFAAPHTPAVHGAKNAKAHLASCRESYLQAKKLIRPDETVLILFSSVAALDRDGDCWEVDVPVTDSNDVFGYLDSKTGALIFSWYDVDE